jgi:hypothetical protein
METAPRVVSGEYVNRLMGANRSNLAAASDIVSLAEHLDPETQKKLALAVQRVVDNANTISEVLLASRTTRG